MKPLHRKFQFFFYLLLLVPMLHMAQRESYTRLDSLKRFNKVLSPDEMRKDLQLFLNVQKEANSGLYIYRTEAQIDSIYRWAFDQIKQPMPITNFFKIIVILTDFEGSVHNYTEPDSELMNFIKKQKTFFPYPLSYIEGQMIFDASHDSILPGSRILSINGKSDKNLMNSFYPYFPADGLTVTNKMSSSVEDSMGWRYVMEYGLVDEFIIEYTAPGSELLQQFTLPAVSFGQQQENWKNRFSAPVTNLLDHTLQSAYGFEMLKPSIGKLNLRWFGMATGSLDPAFEVYTKFLDSVFQVLDKNDVQHLVIDIRNNPGGSDPTFEQPVMYLSDKEFKENTEAYIQFDPEYIPFEDYFWGVETSTRMDSLGLAMGKEFLKDYFNDFSQGKSNQNEKYNPVYHPKSSGYKGKVYLLINENVASAASHFASLLKGYGRNITVIGVETVGGYYVHNGHIPLVYELPNSKIKTKFSIVHVIQDAPIKSDQPWGRGVIPDFEVWQSLEDLLDHKDTQLEFVLKMIDK